MPPELASIYMADKFLHTRWSDITPEPMNPLLNRQFITGSQAMLARIELKKGCTVPRHSHHNEQIAFVESGAMLFRLGEEGHEEDRIIRAGEVLVIPANLPHSAEALEDTIDYDIFAPPRHDWITGDDAYLR
jgi:quercetin dioxygenase-like cupin family protein